MSITDDFEKSTQDLKAEIQTLRQQKTEINARIRSLKSIIDIKKYREKKAKECEYDYREDV